jgi:hypothetical protein
MSEKPQSDDFDEDDVADIVPGSDDGDLDHLMRDYDTQRRRAPKGVSAVEPAWRRLERLREEKRTAELVSDFNDYEVGGDGAEVAERSAAVRKKRKLR